MIRILSYRATYSALIVAWIIIATAQVQGAEISGEARVIDGEPHKSSQALIANWVIDHRLGNQLKPILDKKPHCLLIEPPDSTWCEPIARAIRSRIRSDSLLSRNREYTITPDECPKRRQHAYKQRDICRNSAVFALAVGHVSVAQAICIVPRGEITGAFSVGVNTSMRFPMIFDSPWTIRSAPFAELPFSREWPHEVGSHG